MINKNIQNLIDTLTPYQEENFITFPLQEEGNFLPTINIWQIFSKLPFDVNTDYELQYDFIPENIGVLVNVEERHKTNITLNDIFFNADTPSNYSRDDINELNNSNEIIYYCTFEIYDNRDIINSNFEYDLEQLLIIANKIIEVYKLNN